MATINSDIYNIVSIIEDIKASYIEESEDTLAVSTFGYLGSIASDSLREIINAIYKLSNESITSKATLPKNIITYAIQNDVDGITASPSKMKVRMAFSQKELLKLMKDSNSLILDKNWKITIGDFEFHLDYDLKITKTDLSGGKYVFSAMYDIDRNNPLSDITNPYLDPPNTIILDGITVIVFTLTIRQISHISINKKFISNNIIENKTFIFEFDDQLASFDIKDIGTGNYIEPIYQGEITPTNSNFCYYSYLDNNKIRIKFDNESYMPSLNTELEVLVKTTKGTSGIFEYTTNEEVIVTSDMFDYNNLTALIIPVTNSLDGKDQKTTKELQAQIPIASVAKGNIGNDKDLKDYLNSLNNETSRLKIRTKADNQFERSYYSYLLMKDDKNNIIPTNTINIMIDLDSFDSVDEVGDEKRYTLKQGSYILYDGKSTAKVVKTPSEEELEESKFIYTTPFMISVYKNILQSSFYLSIIDEQYEINYDYINEESTLQFVASNVTWKRKYLDNPSQYNLSIQLTQNITTDMNTVIEEPVLDEEGNDTGEVTVINNMRVFIVLYEENTPYRYMEAELTGYDLSAYTFRFETIFESEDIFDRDNYIRIKETHITNETDVIDYGYFNPNSETRIYVLYKSDVDYGRYDIDQFIPGLEGYNVSNVYSIVGGLQFFKNYSEILSCVISPISYEDEEGAKEGYILKNVPVVRRSYMNDEDKINKMIDVLDEKKKYIEEAISLMDGFSIDFKFINSYGPSKLYTLKDGTLLDRINISLKFEVELLDNIDKNVTSFIRDDIKTLIEDMDTIDTFHIMTLCTNIKTKYENSILYIDFKGINDYNESYKKLTLNDDENETPEFLNVENLEDDETIPDIDISIV